MYILTFSCVFLVAVVQTDLQLVIILIICTFKKSVYSLCILVDFKSSIKGQSKLTINYISRYDSTVREKKNTWLIIISDLRTPIFKWNIEHTFTSSDIAQELTSNHPYFLSDNACLSEAELICCCFS